MRDKITFYIWSAS